MTRSAQSTIIGLCGPNGFGKSTVYHALVREHGLEGLPWINADAILVQMAQNTAIPFAPFGLSDVTAAEFILAAETHSLAESIRAMVERLA